MSIGAAAAAAASVALLDAAAGAGVPFSFYQTGSIPVNTSETDLVVRPPNPNAGSSLYLTVSRC